MQNSDVTDDPHGCVSFFAGTSANGMIRWIKFDNSKENAQFCTGIEQARCHPLFRTHTICADKLLEEVIRPECETQDYFPTLAKPNFVPMYSLKTIEQHLKPYLHVSFFVFYSLHLCHILIQASRFCSWQCMQIVPPSIQQIEYILLHIPPEVTSDVCEPSAVRNLPAMLFELSLRIGQVYYVFLASKLVFYLLD